MLPKILSHVRRMVLTERGHMRTEKPNSTAILMLLPRIWASAGALISSSSLMTSWGNAYVLERRSQLRFPPPYILWHFQQENDSRLGESNIESTPIDTVNRRAIIANLLQRGQGFYPVLQLQQIIYQHLKQQLRECQLTFTNLVHTFMYSYFFSVTFMKIRLHLEQQFSLQTLLQSIL